MKKLLIIPLLILPLLCFSQSRAVRHLKSDLSGVRGINTFRINGALIKIASALAELSDENDEDIELIRNASRNIKSLDLINITDKDAFREYDRENFIRDIEEEGYEELIRVREHDRDVVVYSQGSDEENLRDVVIINEEDFGYNIISINGKISMKDLSVMID